MRIALCALSVALLGTSLGAAPVLVAVDLPDATAHLAWAELEFPTYAYVEPTAFGQVDEADLPLLRRRGWGVTVLDRTPWRGRYFLGSVPQALRARLTGRVLWERDDAVFLTASPEEAPTLLGLPIRWQHVMPRPFSRRFFEQFALPSVALRALPHDPAIQAIVDEVNADSLTSFIQRLQDFGSRLILGDSSYAASQWLFDTFSSWGYETRFDSFFIPRPVLGNWPGVGWERNVIARKHGSHGVGTRYVIGGHFDSIVWSDTALARINAPGADDNATGTAGALEAARVLRNVTLEKDVDFAAWGAEEIGLVGSWIYTLQATSQGDDIGGMINMDMTGYMDDPRLDCMIQYAASPTLWFAELYEAVGRTYVPSLTVRPTTSSGGSDWYPFAMMGYPSVGAAEDARSHFNPHYHSPTDRIETLSPALYTSITKTSVATLVVLCTYPGQVCGISVQDMGDGHSVTVRWLPNTEPDIVGYWVWWESEGLTDSAWVAGASSTTCLVTGLAEGVTYTVVVRAADADGHQSYRATELTVQPRAVPLPPSGVAATPIPGGIRVDWFRNLEADIASYRVHRRVDEGDFTLVTWTVDTTFTDPGLSGASRYSYRIEAVDLDGNVSAPSAIAWGRPLTLDQGILVVDETRNHTTPPDSVQDAFYRQILEGFTFEEFDYGSPDQEPTLSDLAPYSTVVWHADDFAQFMASGHVEEFRTYLDAGGKMWLVGWKLAANLAGSAAYPLTFEPGSFMRDYVGIERAEVSGPADSVRGCHGEGGFPDLRVDASKIPTPAWGGTLRYVEAVLPAEGTTVVYRADVSNPLFDEAPCGVQFPAEEPRVVYFGFPLSFMQTQAARQAARIVLTRLGEPLATGDEPPVPGVALRLEASPNPFARSTSITALVPGSGLARLRIFDVGGRAVATLWEGPVRAGVLRAAWHGFDDEGRPVASGVYLCTLEGAGSVTTRPLLLLR